MSEELYAAIVAELPGWEAMGVGSGSTMGDKLAMPNGPGWVICGKYEGVPYCKVTWAAADSDDTPDDPVAAARWLHAHAMSRAAPKAELSTEATLEPVRTVALDTESDEESVAPRGTSEEHGDYDAALLEAPGAAEPSLGGDAERPDDAAEEPLEGELEPYRGEPLADEYEPDTIEADFGELEGGDAFPELEAPEELGAEILDEGQDAASVAHMYGDSLHVMRLAKIGAVTRHARSISPFWTTDQDAALRDLRNYAAGVGEGRWPYDEGRRQELDVLEAKLSRMRAIEDAAKDKVEFLENAERPEVEAFDPEAGWP